MRTNSRSGRVPCSAKSPAFGWAWRCRRPPLFAGPLVRRSIRLGSFLAVLAVTVCGSALAGAVLPPIATAGDPCPSHLVRVEAGDRRDRDNACQGAAEAIEFLRARGLVTDFAFAIRLVDLLTAPCDASVLAHYRPGRDFVEILTFRACREAAPRGNVLGLPLDDELYQSLVAHEAAHFIAEKNFRIARPSLAAQEYIASTVQLGTLPQPLRERILASRVLEGFGADSEISSLYYALDPQAFAVKAWRHHIRPENGATFYQHLLDGGFRRSGGGQP